ANSLDILIDEILDEFNITLSLEARQCLHQNIGEDRLASRSELEKLCLYTLKKTHIALEDVKAIVSDVSVLSQDEVIDAVLLGDLASCEIYFSRCAAVNNTSFFVLNAAQRHFQQLQLLRYQVEIEGKTPLVVISQAQPPIFFQRKKIVEQALRYWNLEKILYAMKKIQSAILESRKNPLLSEVIIHQILLKLTIIAKRQKNFQDI
ncbi:MAG: DNA polymerase III subunit delta, partial [Bartonella sp.]|nr:DNA polymerase III subunit delta [Bartonella sp.]